ncbi:hypothetical protein SAY86_005553 [Trapa natans]|uniref:GDSL esterase/lipase n=1 Tax=Trapa natans TaxID=22666 RepID=A0AAN7L1L9_TRANT|nr:hypothetical protein SAY86_005553 [Trapa natans]
MEMMLRMFLLAALMLAVVSADTAAAKPVTFVFGDSLTEVGNNNYLQSLAKANYPYYGIDYEGGRATGRFTNGRTIGDIISEKLGIPSPPPYLSLAPNDDKFLEGVNYASGGAGILNDTGLYFIQRLSFDDQIESFNKTKQAIVGKIGQAAADRFSNKALYFIGIGSNDYVNNFLQPFLPDGLQYTHDEFVELLASTLEKQLKRLYKLGARKMIVHGLGPLGCIPSQRMKSTTGGCLKKVNQWVLEFNAQVQNLTTSLGRQLPKSQVVFADTYNAVLDLITKPSTYGKLKLPSKLYSIFLIEQWMSLADFSLTKLTQVSKSPILHAVMWTQNWEDFARQIPRCARIAMTTCSGMPFTHLMQQMQCLPIIYSPAYLLKLLPLLQPPNNFIKCPNERKRF